MCINIVSVVSFLTMFWYSKIIDSFSFLIYLPKSIKFLDNISKVYQQVFDNQFVKSFLHGETKISGKTEQKTT